MTMQQAEIASPSDGAAVDSAKPETGTEDSATSATETGAAKNDASSESPEKKRDDVQERFDKLTRERYEAQARAEIAEARREAVEARLAEFEQEKAKPSQVAPDNLPTLESVGYDEQKFTAALAAHFSTLAETRGEAAATKAFEKFMAAQSEQSTRSAWEKRGAEFAKSKPDYLAKVHNAPTLPISQDLQKKLAVMEDGPELAYYLVENKEKAAAIMRMPIEFQMMEVGRIQGELAASKKAAKPPVSQAPPPVSKVDATDAPSTFKVDSADSDQLSDAEWTRRRNAQELARRKRANS